MYNIDINFLSDRSDRNVVGSSRSLPQDNRPLLLGVGVGAGLLALTAGLWGLLQVQNNGLQAKQADLEGQLGLLTDRLKKMDAIKKQTADIKAETNAYAGVFNQVNPWSSLFQEIRARTPVGVQIQSITQAETVIAPATPSPKPGAAPNPPANTAPPPPGGNNAAPNAAPNAAATPALPPVSTANITIAGVARSFSDVNDFVLVLQQSRFLKADQTKLLKSELTNSPVQIDLSKVKLQPGAVVSLPKVVSFQVQSTLTDVPASQLIADLNSNGAVGLVNRIETLRTKGVIQP